MIEDNSKDLQSEIKGTSFSPPKWAFPLALVLMLGLHMALTFYFERPELIFSDEPNAWLDYDTHIEQVWSVTEALDGWGKAWSYDPYLLAGYPNGTIFDADNKGWELWTFALWKLGLSKGMAFNLFILLAHLMVPWLVFWSAGLFGLNKWTSLLAGFLGMMIWYFDSFPHWCWWVGMIAYGIGGYFFLLPMAAFYRYLKDKKIRHLILLAITLSIGHLIHPYVFVIVVFPMLVLYGRELKKLSWKQHAGIISAALTVIAVNFYWLFTALRFWHYILDSSFYCQSTISFFFSDYLGLLKEPTVTGVLGNCTSFRFVAIIGAFIGLFFWKKSKDDRFWPFAVGIGAMLAFTYLGGYSLTVSQIQPYRHIMPVMFLSIIPAAWLFEKAWLSRAMHGLPTKVYLVGGLAAMLVLVNMSRDVLYFFPKILPDPNMSGDSQIGVTMVNPGFKNVTGAKGAHMEFRHEKTFDDFTKIANWLKKSDDGHGRILVEWWVLGEHLTWRTNSQILGGFFERNMDHAAAANLFRHEEEGDVGEEELKKYLEDYAVKWVLLSRPNLKIEKYTNLLTPAGKIEPIHRLYKTNIQVSYFAQNHGKVKASLNLIDVTGTDPNEDVVLRFHYLETLICENDCKVVKEPMKNNPVGFIRVPAPHPADFKIVNGY